MDRDNAASSGDGKSGKETAKESSDTDRDEGKAGGEGTEDSAGKKEESTEGEETDKEKGTDTGKGVEEKTAAEEKAEEKTKVDDGKSTGDDEGKSEEKPEDKAEEEAVDDKPRVAPINARQKMGLQINIANACSEFEGPWQAQSLLRHGRARDRKEPSHSNTKDGYRDCITKQVNMLRFAATPNQKMIMKLRIPGR